MRDFVLVQMTGINAKGRTIYSDIQKVPLELLPMAATNLQADHPEIVRVVFDIALNQVETEGERNMRNQAAVIAQGERDNVHVVVKRDPMLSSITRPGSIAKPKIGGKPKMLPERHSVRRTTRLDVEINKR